MFPKVPKATNYFLASLYVYCPPFDAVKSPVRAGTKEVWMAGLVYNKMLFLTTLFGFDWKD